MFDLTPSFFRDPHYRSHRAIALDHVISKRVRRWISLLAGFLVFLYIVISLIPLVQERLAHGVTVRGNSLFRLPFSKTMIVPAADDVSLPERAELPNAIPFVGGTKIPLNPENPTLNGLFFIVLSIWLVMKMLTFYGRSYYYLIDGRLERGISGAQTPYSFPNYDVCAIYYDTHQGDLVKSYCTSPTGRAILRRTGIADETVDEFLSRREHVIDFEQLETDLRNVFTLYDLSRVLTEKDPDFYQFLFELGVRNRDLVGAAEWVERGIKKQRQKERWWGKVSLGQSKSFGADLAYGGAYLLSRYSEDISRKAISGGSNFRFIYGNEQIKQLENVLARAKEANAILVGEEGSGKMDVVLDFARDIMNGYINPSLKNKRVMAFNAAGFVANMKSKSELETSLIKLMNDAVKAGNIILVIDDLPGFIQGGLMHDSDVMSIIDPYLSTDSIQIIGLADNTRFHQFIEPNNAIMQRFEKVVLTEPAEESLIRIIEEVADDAEKHSRIFFTHPAIVEIIQSAQNYFSDGVMPNKAIDVLVELTPWMIARGGYMVKKIDVLSFIHEKTNIPVGNISADERERLLGLEKLMRNLVIGQEEAINIIANAMRRSRAGVINTKRPIGAFLFLGPTGVGKTETAKALATVFFGNENAMSRIDMSEYQGEDGLNRMIGAMDGTPGTLPVMLKEHPYGVVLLDEFEKTNPKVLDLFLQILDEGVFHDAQGKKVNGRNSIFIATSNAGAAEIRDAMHRGVPLDEAKKKIVDTIIAQGKLKPELFNRFDGIILFHPLTQADYEKIAVLMLEKLKKRLRDKSLNLEINDVLVQAVLAHGVDPDFGARPMVRAIQDVVEQRIAEKIIKGGLTPGSSIVFGPDDFPEVFSSEAQTQEQARMQMPPPQTPQEVSAGQG